MDADEINQNGDTRKGKPGEPSFHDLIFSIEPELLARVGSEYQVEIPPLLSQTDYHAYLKSPIDAKEKDGVPCEFLMGLPIPVVPAHERADGKKSEVLGVHGSGSTNSEKGSLELASVRDMQMYTTKEDPKLDIEPFNSSLGNGLRTGELTNLAVEDAMDQYRGPGFRLLPGTVNDSWSDIEKSSFFFAMCIFRKDFDKVKKFIEIKKMGDILSFFYGKFYGSDDHSRWSGFRKSRRKKCVYGHKIFTGLRQQELLSRLLPLVSREYQHILMEVTKTFMEGKIHFEEYALSLKAIVGLNILVEAVGIGKGKQDITSRTFEPLRSNQVISVRSEIPIGKACSSLTSREIIKFLTGDYRLSKARSNDLFWEAVWPRLLARGWHSEQPNSQGYSMGPKNSLVYLVPGVKKFSRRRLVKGNHYFDSVSDVLNKVASEPGLLELNTEEDDEGDREGNGGRAETKSDEDDMPDKRRHCYLRPRTPNRNTDGMTFTVVDTSQTDGRTVKMRELRMLPFENSKRLAFTNYSEDSDEDSSEVSSSESKSSGSRQFNQDEINNGQVIERVSDGRITSDVISNCMDALEQIGSISANVTLNNFNNRNYLLAEKQPIKAARCHLPKKLAQDNLNYLMPVTKRRRRLTACCHAETSYGMVDFSVGPKPKKEKQSFCSDTSELNKNLLSLVGSSQDKSAAACSNAEASHGTISFSVDPRLKQDRQSCYSDAPQSSENNLSQLGSSLEKLASSSSSEDSPVESTECSLNDNCRAQEGFQKSEPWTVIDLNLPHVLADFETNVLVTETTEMQRNCTSKGQIDQKIEEEIQSVGTCLMKLAGQGDSINRETGDSYDLKTSVDVATSQQQPDMNTRRQGTRNRPPTARALEALACGFLTTNRGRKNKKPSSRENSARPSKYICSGVEFPVPEISTDTMVSKVEESGQGVCSDAHTSVLRTFQFLPEGNGTQVPGP